MVVVASCSEHGTLLGERSTVVVMVVAVSCSEHGTLLGERSTVVVMVVAVSCSEHGTVLGERSTVVVIVVAASCSGQGVMLRERSRVTVVVITVGVNTGQEKDDVTTCVSNTVFVIVSVTVSVRVDAMVSVDVAFATTVAPVGGAAGTNICATKINGCEYYNACAMLYTPHLSRYCRVNVRPSMVTAEAGKKSPNGVR